MSESTVKTHVSKIYEKLGPQPCRPSCRRCGWVWSRRARSPPTAELAATTRISASRAAGRGEWPHASSRRTCPSGYRAGTDDDDQERREDATAAGNRILTVTFCAFASAR